VLTKPQDRSPEFRPCSDIPSSSTPKRRCRRQPSIPKELLADIRWISRKYRDQFSADPELKARVLRLARALLPPRPRRRGRPGDPAVTRALRLFRKFRRKYPGEPPRETWSRIYPRVIPCYDRMTELEQRTERERLQERIGWRRRKRPRKILAQFSVS
jgi:hypothetical protein